MSYVLILFFHVGMMAAGNNSMAVTNISYFRTEESCIAAGEKAKILVKGTVKEVSFICVQQPR